MRFVDQGWRQIDHQSATAPKSDSSSIAVTTQIPSLHVFTPRMRTMIQCSRLHNRMTIHDLAKRVGVDPKDLIAIEEGRQFPANRTLESLQEILNVDLVPGGRTDGAKKLSK